MDNRPETAEEKKVTLGQRIRIIIGTALAIFLITMTVQNWVTIDLSLVFRRFDVPLPLIIIVTLVTGYVWGSFAGRRKNRSENSNDINRP